MGAVSAAPASPVLPSPCGCSGFISGRLEEMCVRCLDQQAALAERSLFGPALQDRMRAIARVLGQQMRLREAAGEPTAYVELPLNRRQRRALVRARSN